MEQISSLKFLTDLFANLGDEIFVVDVDGNVKFKNETATNLYPKVKNLNKLSHFFNFKICILKSDDIMTYTPIFAGISSSESFFASLTKQINEKTFIEYSMRAIPLENGLKVIIFKNDATSSLFEKNQALEEKNTKLEEQVISTVELKSRLENQLLRTNLVNLVSDKVREFISTQKIIKIVLEQLKKTFDVAKVEFLPEFHSDKAGISSEIDEKNLLTKLFVPVVQEKKVYGALVLHRKTTQNTWQKEEIDLVKNICSLLATSFSKEELYNELESQKKELEKTLEQLKNAQLQIVQSEKMATLGQLVAGVAHEINTPLGAISSNFDLLEKFAETLPVDDELAELVRETAPVNQEAIRRISRLIKSLKNFTRLDEAKKKMVDLKDGILSTIALIEHETKNKVEIKTDFANLPLVSCYPDYINQVFMNIMLNACQSIKDNGEVLVATVLEGDFAKVSISDNGSGISKDNLNKIFDFGFTTKKIGQGTGLGLALAKKIIDEHNGKITVDSTVGKGTTFNIYLPLC